MSEQKPFRYWVEEDGRHVKHPSYFHRATKIDFILEMPDLDSEVYRFKNKVTRRTPFLDFNDRYIYEGDFVDMSDFPSKANLVIPYLVIAGGKRTAFQVTGKVINSAMDLTKIRADEVRIIGNIFESPDLVEESPIAKALLANYQ